MGLSAAHQSFSSCPMKLQNLSGQSRVSQKRTLIRSPCQSVNLRRLIPPDLCMRRSRIPQSASARLRSQEAPRQTTLSSAQLPLNLNIRQRSLTPSRNLSSASRIGASAGCLSQKVKSPSKYLSQNAQSPAPPRLILARTVESRPLFGFRETNLVYAKRRRRSSVVTAAKWWKKWSRRQDSDLHKDRPPGLPLTMKDIEPLPPEELEARLNCDVEMEVRTTLYTWIAFQN